MRKITIILVCVLCQLSVANAAKLPSVGYEGPYQNYDNMDYDNLIDYGSVTPFAIAADKETPEKFTCLPWHSLTLVCMSCFLDIYKDVQLPNGGSLVNINIGDPCDILDAIYGGYASDLFDAYESCSAESCGIGAIGNCATNNPPLGCPTGAETPLIFFAFSYLAVRIWRKKKDA